MQTKSPEKPEAPRDFAAKPGFLRVTLTWTTGSSGSKVDHFVLFRNGVKLSLLPASDTSYTDLSVLPRHLYVYGIQAEAGSLVSVLVETTAAVREPPLVGARVEGSFFVWGKTVSVEGFSSYSQRRFFTWFFTPKCKKGACDIIWGDQEQHGAHAILHFDGHAYQGVYTGPFHDYCQGKLVTQVVDIRLRVAKAKDSKGAWIATKLVGSYVQQASEQFGCVATRAAVSLVGTRYLK